MQVLSIGIENIATRHRSFLSRDEKYELEKLISILPEGDRKVVLSPYGNDGHWAICKGYNIIKEAEKHGDKTIRATVLLNDETPHVQDYIEEEFSRLKI